MALSKESWFIMNKDPLKNSQYPGLRFEMSSKASKNFYGLGKVFLKGNRLYLAVFIGKDELPSQEKMKGFLSSFKTFD